MLKALSPLRRAIIAGYALACLGFLVSTGSWDGMGTLLFAVPLFFWMILPVTGLALAQPLGQITAIGAVVIGLGGLYLYWRAFFGPDMDPQSALAYIVLPVYQMLASLPVIIAALIAIKIGQGRK
ncbi:hypothetical protein G6N82_06525 [Altererythrobacter sp. BO-6]|uniref:hypothetical protein n=1 Tax=Altererythrobacter sp. BO-6 TaxID=2604537 RepID=UPI0013E1DDD8|nr:hypothetical protein [Altererythrobacter sp. BO-6]QIG53853.1 hypothetical protein G6N82_06525 [Altererythrobacter sp. BO-6]